MRSLVGLLLILSVFISLILAGAAEHFTQKLFRNGADGLNPGGAGRDGKAVHAAALVSEGA